MTFNEDQLKAYVKQTAQEVGDVVAEKLEKRMDEKIEMHSLKCGQTGGLSGKQLMALVTVISSVIIGIVEIIKTYFTKGN
jgi:hypothetical protein